MTEDPGVLPKADEADELEQVRDAVPGGDDQPNRDDSVWGADEADVMEQTRSLPLTDEDEAPDEE